MLTDRRNEANSRRKMGEDPEESEALLTTPSHDDDNASTRSAPLRRPLLERRQSSISKPPANGQPRTPRTPNRVRFDIAERESSEHSQDEHLPVNTIELRRGALDEQDETHDNLFSSHRSSTGQRAPLLTGIEARSVTVADADVDFNLEDLLETARPKSGMRSAFMNMANSIMQVPLWN